MEHAGIMFVPAPSLSSECEEPEDPANPPPSGCCIQPWREIHQNLQMRIGNPYASQVPATHMYLRLDLEVSFEKCSIVADLYKFPRGSALVTPAKESLPIPGLSSGGVHASG
jgi:hypothetical protein